MWSNECFYLSGVAMHALLQSYKKNPVIRNFDLSILNEII